MKGPYVASQRVLGGLLCVVGIAMLVSAIARGGGPLALGVIVGVLFTALGAARIWLTRAGEREAER